MIIDLITGLTYATEGEFLALDNGNPYWDVSKSAKEQEIANYNYMIIRLTELTAAVYPDIVNETVDGTERKKALEWIEHLPEGTDPNDNENLPVSTLTIQLERDYFSDVSTERSFDTIKKFEIKITIQ